MASGLIRDFAEIMTLPEPQVHGWITSLVDRTADQLRAELALLVRRVQDAAPAHEVALAHAPVSTPAPEAETPGRPAAVSAFSEREGQAGLTVAADMLEAVAALDEAPSLTDILNVLVERTSIHAGRVLLVLARGDALIGWRSHGYAGDPHDATALAIGPEDQGLVMQAARSGSTETGFAAAAGGMGDTPAVQNRVAVAVPLRVDGQIVAVLYADAANAGAELDANAVQTPGPVRSLLPETVGVLARHAARCLESMTARRLQELVRRPVAGDTVQAVQAG
jgi:hypothetical protein